MTRRRRWVVLATLNLAVLIVAIDATVLNLAVPEITADLKPSATQTLWILDIYSLVLAGLLISAGTLSDRLGRKRVLLAGCALFGVASILAAFAPTAEWLIAARVLLGVGGATIMPSTLAIIRNVFTDPRERTLAIGLWSAMAAAGAAIGPIVGGVLLEHFWWGSVFLINVPIMLLLLVVGAAALPEFRSSMPGRWDWPSAVASMVGLVAFVLAIKQVAEHGVNATVAASTAVAFGSLAWFVHRQGRIAVPLIDISLFRRPAFTGAVLGNFIALFALAGLLLFVSQYLQLVLNYSPLDAGIRMLPLTLGAFIGAPISSVLVRRAGAHWTVAGGLAAAAAGMVGFALALDAHSIVFATMMAVVGAGVALALTATSDAIVGAVPASRAGAASSISETAYELGTGLGIAILGSTLTALYAAALPPLPGLSVETSETLQSSLVAAGNLPSTAASEVGEAARAAFTLSLEQTTYISAFLLAAAAGLTAYLMRGKPQAGAKLP